MSGMKGGEKLENEQVEPRPICPKLIKELHEIIGLLQGVEPTSAKLLAVQIGRRNVFLPIKFQARLEGLRGQKIGVTLIRGKHYMRQLPPSAPSEGDLLRVRVAELEAENVRLRAAQRGLDDGRAGPCTL